MKGDIINKSVKRLIFNKEQRNLISDKIIDLGHILVLTLCFSQFLNDKPFQISAAIIGIVALFSFYSIGIFLKKEK
jgi:hypothetical protein